MKARRLAPPTPWRKNYLTGAFLFILFTLAISASFFITLYWAATL